MKIFAATKNAHKLTELKRILEPMGFEVLSENDYKKDYPDVEETGTTFEENAILKAKAGLAFTGLPTVADDSGLCVDALDGAPGIMSARFSGNENQSDEANNAKLLKVLKDVPKNERNAHYVSVIACIFPDNRQFTAKGECFGFISDKPIGNNGFGYDPLFITETGKTFGQMTADEKDKISHRSKSLKIFSKKIKEFL